MTSIDFKNHFNVYSFIIYKKYSFYAMNFVTLNVCSKLFKVIRSQNTKMG